MLKSRLVERALREAIEDTNAILDEFEAQIIEEFELDSDGDPSKYIHREGNKIVVEWPFESHGEEGGFDKMTVTTFGLTVYASYPNDDYSEYEEDVTKLKWGTDTELGKKAITAVCNNLYWGYADRWCINLIKRLKVTN